MRILGIDTSLRCSGFGVIERVAGALRAVEFGTIRNPASAPHSVCLCRLHDALSDLIARRKPDVAAIEGGFFFKNAKTALVLGEARGVTIAVFACRGIPIFEYSPRSVKQGLTGSGGAQKDQVARMVMAVLGLSEKPAEDAADALAIAICHAHGQSGIAALQSKPL